MHMAIPYHTYHTIANSCDCSPAQISPHFALKKRMIALLWANSKKSRILSYKCDQLEKSC